MLMFVGGLQ